MQNLYHDLQILLQQDDRLVVDGKLLKNKIIELALAMDSGLLKLLLSNPKIKEHFFIEVDGVQVFDKVKFQKFISNKQFLPDSYTAYKNKIGLTYNDEYITENKDVVLVWPYKDCVLEGGQTKEDAKRNEIFWNETLAPDEIDLLLSPKVLTNFKKYHKDGEHKVTNLSINDNLIIKGNNLLAIQSLLRIFLGKIKLIYIDPPYNRENEGNDFLYNDNFNHSTWLTFMKTRLEIAQKLLKNDGLIWISISDDEGHYLKIICDEIFKRENFVADVIWNSTKSVTNTAVISDSHTHNLLYAKNKFLLKQNRNSFRLPADETKFSNPDNDPNGKWVADPFQVGGIRKNQLYPITNPKTGEIYRPLPGNSWKNEKIVFDELIKQGRIVFGVNGESGPQRKRYWKEAKERGEVTTTLWHDLPTTTNATRHLKDLFGDRVFNGPKPEGLIQRIIELSTNTNDLILDFFAGSGTTPSVALKMNRRFIACEQLNYIDNVTIERLKKVIQGEQGGISKDVNWQGGGSFIYCELAKSNQEYIEKIQIAKTKKQLQEIWTAMQEKAFISYNVDISSINNKADGFEDLTIEEQQRFLVEILDKNLLYVPYSSIDDKDYNISEEDKKLNKMFYNLK